MKNKILIRVYVPAIHEEYEVFIPTNESIKKVLSLIVKSVNELADDILMEENLCLLDPDNSVIYPLSVLVRNTNILNDKKVMLV